MLKPTSTAPPSTPAAPEPDDQKIGDGVPVVDDRDSSALSPTVGRYRPHARPGRTRQVRLRYTSQEYQAVARAANAAGLTTTGYVAEAALAAAAGAEPPVGTPWREALTELMAARAQVRRIGLNINQATRVLNATGEQPVWLEQALAMAEQAVIRLDDAATDVADTARRHRLVHPRRPHKL
jgi:hypothetical protein